MAKAELGTIGEDTVLILNTTDKDMHMASVASRLLHHKVRHMLICPPVGQGCLCSVGSGLSPTCSIRTPKFLCFKALKLHRSPKLGEYIYQGRQITDGTQLQWGPGVA